MVKIREGDASAKEKMMIKSIVSMVSTESVSLFDCLTWMGSLGKHHFWP